MFLGAGSVMHGMNDDVNMRHYGALSKYMKYTYYTFLMGYLAIIGVPGFAGWFSKDGIIDVAFATNPLVGVCAMVGAGITAFYMTRLMFMTFWSEKRWEPGVHPHESPKVMTIPLIVLAIFSVVGGLLMFSWIQTWLEPAAGNHVEAFNPLSLPGIATLILVIIGVLIGWNAFGRRPVPAVAPASKNVFTVTGRNVLFGDQINDAVVVQPTYALASGVHAVDEYALDGGADHLARAFGGLSTQVRKWESGYARSYALTMMTGVVLAAVVLILSHVA